MAQILNFPIGRDRLYANLSRCERDFVETLLHLTPNYSYELSGLAEAQPAARAGGSVCHCGGQNDYRVNP